MDMPRKKLSQVLHEVDPSLKVVESGHHGRSDEKPQGEVYLLRDLQTTDKDWNNAAGVICSQCGTETFRCRDGLCMTCWEKKHEIEIRDRAGVLSFMPATVFTEIVRRPKNASK